VNGQLPKTEPLAIANFGGQWATTVPVSRILLLSVGDVVNLVCDAFGDRVFGTHASLILQHVPGAIPPGQ
jgi:hypothetical protein